MKVKVRKLTFAQRVAERLAEWDEKERAQKSEDEKIIIRLTELRPENADVRLQSDMEWRRYEKQREIRDQLEREYFEMFPDDPMMAYCLDVDSTPVFDPFIMSDMYKWAIENHRHWYEWQDLPKPYVPNYQLIWRECHHDTKS